MKKLLFLAGGLALVLIGLGLRYYALPAYRHHKEVRFVEQARDYLAKKDYRNANLTARQARRLNPDNLEACRIMAELGEMSHSPQAIDLRRRIAELEPTVENKVMLASVEMRAQSKPYPLATQTLDELRSSGANVAGYHAVRAELALRLNQPEEAANEYETASRLDPTNELHQFNLAVLRIRSTNELAASQARQTLERLSTNGGQSAFALRWLVTENLGRKDLAGAEKFSRQLVAGSSNLDDRLQHLDILQQARTGEFDSFLSGLKSTASTNAGEIYGLCHWLIGHGMTDEAFNWLTNCPAKVRAEQPAPRAMVECLAAKRDWPALEKYLQGQKWGDLEFLRLAFLSRTSEQQKQPLGVESRWRAAVREAGDRAGLLTALLELASAWGRTQEREDLLWVIEERCPRERWTLRELERIYLGQGNTRGLNKLYAATSNLDSKDYVAANNLATTSMLLKMNLAKAHVLAREVYQEHPEEPAFVSTYAYSLHLQGRSKEGLAALEKLDGKLLERAPVALYYGLLLSAASKTNEATKYLELAQTGNLLPEEKVLLKRVKAL